MAKDKTISWRTLLSFFVDGRPKPQPQRRLNPKTNTYFFPHDADDWKKLVTTTAFAELAKYGNPSRFPLRGPINVGLHFRLPRPARITSFGRVPHDNRPDLDNLEKAVFDALTHAKLWKDDSQVCAKISSKVYAGRGEAIGMYATISVVQ